MPRDQELYDRARDRQIPVRVYRPQNWNRATIVFSHGLGGGRAGYRFLAEWWAEHGFTVVLPTHFGSDESIYGGGRPQRHSEAGRRATMDPRNWRDRPLDISFVISALDEILGEKFDRARLGVGGHSFGTYTTAALAGMEVEMPGDGLVSFVDERPRAFLGMSPQGPAPATGGMPYRATGWAAIHRPMLLLTGTLDRGYDDQPAEWRTEPFADLPAGDHYLAVLRDADHLTFVGVGTHAKPGALNSVRALTLLFWQAYLLADATALTKLTQVPPEFSRFEHK